VPKSYLDDLRELSDVEIDLNGPLTGDDESVGQLKFRSGPE
jgi:hypothetical protein